MTFLRVDIEELDARGLRKFGLMMAFLIATTFGVIVPWWAGANTALWPWILAGVFAGFGLLNSKPLKWPYRIWMCFGVIMSKVMNPLILGIVFFLIIFPTSLVLRLMGKKLLNLGKDDSVASYRENSKTRSPGHMTKPY